MAVRRMIDASCWLATGIVACVAAATQSDMPAYFWLIGIAAAAYGVFIGATQRSYWTHTYVYAVPVIVIVLLIWKAQQ